MVALILMGAAVLSLSMGFTGLPRALAEWIAALDLSVFRLIAVLTVFYIIIGCFLDGISAIVLTMAVVDPMGERTRLSGSRLHDDLVRHLRHGRDRDSADHAPDRLQPVRSTR